MSWLENFIRKSTASDTVKNPIKNNCNDNNYLDQIKDLKLFFKKYIGESLLSPIITNDEKKTNYLIQLIDLGFQKNIQITEGNKNLSVIPLIPIYIYI